MFWNRITRSVSGICVLNPSAGLDQGFVKGADLEIESFLTGSVRGDNNLFFQVYFNFDTACGGLLQLEELIDLIFGQFNRKHAAIEHVLSKNPRVTFCDYGMDLIDLEHPWSMFSGGPTTKILPRHDNTGLF